MFLRPTIRNISFSLTPILIPTLIPTVTLLKIWYLPYRTEPCVHFLKVAHINLLRDIVTSLFLKTLGWRCSCKNKKKSPKIVLSFNYNINQKNIIATLQSKISWNYRAMNLTSHSKTKRAFFWESMFFD